MKTETEFESVIRCPLCGDGVTRGLSGLVCNGCQKEFKENNGVFFFDDTYQDHTSDSEFQLDQMAGESLLAKIYNIGSSIVSSDYNPARDLSRFMDDLPEDAIVVEFGSGSRRLSNNIINLDLFPFQNVDFISDIVKTPFKDNSVDFIVLDTVLEHVPEPQKVVDEIFRVLKVGGQVFSVTPLIFPYHGYPKHYYNFTQDGLEYVFRGFDSVNVSTNIGPTSALTNLFSEYFSLLLSGNSKFLYTMFKGLFLVPVFMFKYFDLFIYKREFSKRVASTLCAIATK